MDMVTVYFSDIVGFTKISSDLNSSKVSDLLDRLCSKFDELADAYGVFSLETIGDGTSQQTPNRSLQVTPLIHTGAHASLQVEFMLGSILRVHGLSCYASCPRPRFIFSLPLQPILPSPITAILSKTHTQPSWQDLLWMQYRSIYTLKIATHQSL